MNCDTAKETVDTFVQYNPLQGNCFKIVSTKIYGMVNFWKKFKRAHLTYLQVAKRASPSSNKYIRKGSNEVMNT